MHHVVQSHCSPFSSESCSQVFTILLVWLLQVVEAIPREKWSSVVLAYDNMCHLDALKVARKPLPLPKPFDEMWLAITKVTNTLVMGRNFSTLSTFHYAGN